MRAIRTVPLWIAILLGSSALATNGSAQAVDSTKPVDSGQSASSQNDSEKTFTEPGENGAVLDDMVIEAENEVRQGVEKTSFEFELSAAVIDSFLTEVDAEALEVSPVSGLQPHLNNLDPMVSDQTPHLWLPEIPGTPVATFYPDPEPGRKMSHWQLTITDFRGSPFRSFEGKGSPPDKLIWNGHGDEGQMIQTGYPYSYVFTQTDKGTNTYNHAGVSFRLPALDYQDGDDRVLELSGSELFARTDDALLETGKRWLIQATDIMRQHPYSPFEVVCLAEDADLAKDRATVVAQFLADHMVLPREQVEVSYEQQTDLRSEMDGHVRILIRHAD